MKKLIGAIIGVSLLLVACSSESHASLGRLHELGSDDIGDYDVTVFQDKKTGCQYMAIFGSGKEIIPVLQSDGKPYCTK